jgi:very-short-patch-repair endonuclease
MSDFVGYVSGVRAETRVLTPNPLSKDGEGASNSPSPYLGKGPGDGENKARLRIIDSLCCGDLILTHRNRFMPILEMAQSAYMGEMLEISFQDISLPLYITSDHPVATLATSLPKFEARVATARELRKSSTPSEAILWGFLRNYGPGVKFRRQHPMGPFVLDFYAPAIRLAIEVDGGIHEDRYQRDYDNLRQELIETCGVKFLRLSNNRLEKDVQSVLSEIDEYINERSVRFDHSVEWIPASQLKMGMSVFAPGKSCQRMIIGIQRLETSETVYDIAVTEDHSYVTECCTLHNCESKKNQKRPITANRT